MRLKMLVCSIVFLLMTTWCVSQITQTMENPYFSISINADKPSCQSGDTVVYTINVTYKGSTAWSGFASLGFIIHKAAHQNFSTFSPQPDSFFPPLLAYWDFSSFAGGETKTVVCSTSMADLSGVSEIKDKIDFYHTLSWILFFNRYKYSSGRHTASIAYRKPDYI